MSLFRYSGLTTKVRAMSGKLLTKQDFDQISNLQSVPEVIAWLKKKPSYAAVLGNENENDLHRGQAEGMIRRSFYADFSKLYRFSNLEQRAFLDAYFQRYEIICLKISSARSQERKKRRRILPIWKCLTDIPLSRCSRRLRLRQWTPDHSACRNAVRRRAQKRRHGREGDFVRL